MWWSNATAFVDRLWNPLNGFHEQIGILFTTVTLWLCVPIFLALKDHSPTFVMMFTQAVCVQGFEGEKKGLAGNAAVRLRKGKVQKRIIKRQFKDTQCLLMILVVKQPLKFRSPSRIYPCIHCKSLVKHTLHSHKRELSVSKESVRLSEGTDKSLKTSLADRAEVI